MVAWYQAQASVDIDVSDPESVQITVAAPEDCKIENPILYKYVENGTKGYYDANDVDGLDVTNINYFTPCQSINDLNEITNLWPGYKMSFAIKCTSVRTGGSKGSLTLSSFNPGTNITRYDKDYDNITYKTEFIDLARAINIYAGYSTTSSAFNVLSTDSFGYSSTNPISSSPLISGTTAGSTIYFFLTIEFDDTENSYYEEYVDENCNELVTTTPISGERFFKKSRYGNSNCYEGLTFTMSTLTIAEAQ